MAASINDFVAGVMGGCAGIFIGQPLDVVRVRLMTTSDRTVYRNTLHCAQQIVRKEGFQTFFRGIGPPLLGVGALNAIVFGTYGTASRWLQRNKDPSTPATLGQVYTAGCIAGVFSCLVTAPSEHLKCRTQVSMSAEAVRAGKTHARTVMHQIYREHGIPGLFYGYRLTLMRDSPSFGLYFVVYEGLARLMSPDRALNANSPEMTAREFLELNLAGGVAGSVAWAAIYPIDVVKTRYQTQSMTNPIYKGLLDGFRKLYASEGSAVFFRGLGATILRAFPLNAVTFSVYELTLRFLDSRSNS
eukprot:m.107896 g.107896  ORF g.107896 m.107896 type:complete len:301 (+) comp9235_c1_seq1:84-986(+)